MKRVIAALILLTLLNTFVSAQFTLKIVIRNLENSKGQIIIDFRDGDNKILKAQFGKIIDKQCVVTINNLKTEKYLFKYFHDENENKKLDTNFIGIPKEGYGFSNNAKGNFGPPDYKNTIFEVKNDTTVICKAHYINL